LLRARALVAAATFRTGQERLENLTANHHASTGPQALQLARADSEANGAYGNARDSRNLFNE
jgi:hypothetical protein